jgi:predicted RNA-binding Zn-ribbon protein involved in translation (DUF1610 family)
MSGEASQHDQTRAWQSTDDAPDRCTEFTTDTGLDDDQKEDGAFYFAFVCPRDGCGEKNPLKGDPRKFNKPFRCTECNYVPLLDGDALEAFAEEEYDE